MIGIPHPIPSFRSKPSDPRDFLPPLVGLILIGVLFIPTIRLFLGEGFGWLLGLLVLATIGLILRALWRRGLAKEAEEAPLMPIIIHDDEERAQFRAMMGVREYPSSIKTVTPTATTDDTPPKKVDLN